MPQNSETLKVFAVNVSSKPPPSSMCSGKLVTVGLLGHDFEKRNKITRAESCCATSRNKSWKRKRGALEGVWEKLVCKIAVPALVCKNEDGREVVQELFCEEKDDEVLRGMEMAHQQRCKKV